MSTVSCASGLLVPMIPLGPRLIQPATYSPSRGWPVSGSVTRPRSFGMVAVIGSKGTPGNATPW